MSNSLKTPLAPLRKPAARTVRRTLAGACGLLIAPALPHAALADSMSLSIAPEPVQELASQITWTSSSAGGTFAIVAVNNPGVACAATPQGDAGKVVTGLHFLESGDTGESDGAANYTPPSTGAYTVCGWLTTPAGLMEGEGGRVTASSSLRIDVRAPHISLSLSFPRPVSAGSSFALDLTTTSEVKREVVVEGIPYTRRGCPIDYAASSAQHLIDTEVTGGPWLTRTNIKPSAGSSYIFCAWADAVGDGGLYPQATTSLVLNLTGHHAKSPGKPRRKKVRHGN